MNKKIPIISGVIFYLIFSGIWFLTFRAQNKAEGIDEISSGLIMKSLIFGSCVLIYPLFRYIWKSFKTKQNVSKSNEI
jgi:uncharacterized membrane protein